MYIGRFRSVMMIVVGNGHSDPISILDTVIYT